MSAGLQQSKNRIKSVSATQKITSAMELVATSKLKKVKDLNFKITPFKKETINIISSVINNVSDKDYLFFKSPNQTKDLIIIVTSSLGLCGGYNNNIFKYVKENVDISSDLIVLGSKGVSHFKNNNYHIISENNELPPFDVKENLSSLITYKIVKDFKNSKYKSIKMIYTKFINTLTFEPTIFQLLPINPKIFKGKKNNKELLLEPTAIDVLDELIPFYLTSTIKSLIIEAQLSEQASRRMAMENATDNANELKEQLMLEYNKARQAAITQEISEISGSAEALK